ncbi:ricin-type beta-trefoil lectin domain protein [Streptomyces sp. NPDC020719]|uniref:ricin-type beta-trefoil lectin domain protein n=1 Tax=Streptomyces sp. NPDC020719 TaxID=3154896 RepID=UPI0033F251A1
MSVVPFGLPGRGSPGSRSRRTGGGRRRAGSLAALLALALGVGLPPSAVAAPSGPGRPGSGPADVAAAIRAGDARNVKAAATAGDPAGRPKGAVAKAVAEARRTKRDVQVTELTDEFATTYATPGGKLRTEQHTEVQRVKQGGAWRAPDDRLAPRADGTFAPVAALDSLVISGGGSGPLATMTAKDGKQLSVSSPFPGALPKPAVDGNRALFHAVAPDTDLVVTATKEGGFTTVVVLNTPAAAANPAVRKLTFRTDTKGVRLTADKSGTLRATEGGQTVFTAPTPRMWSASAPSGTATAYTGERRATTGLAATLKPKSPAGASGSHSTVDGPAANAPAADIAVRTTGDVTRAAARTDRHSGAVTLTPSAALLDDKHTPYPVYVDPSWSNDSRGKSHHAWVMQAHTTTGNFDRTGSADRDHPGMGFQGWETQTGIERSLFEFDLNGYAGATVNYANLRVAQYISSDWSCTNTYPVNVYHAGAFDGGINWGNHRTYEWVDGKNVPGNGTQKECYGDIPLDFNITAPMRNALGDTGTPLAFALVGAEGGGDKMGFKRFSYDATLSTEYDFTPNKPGNPHITPTTPHRVTGADTDACWDAPVGSYGWVTDTRATLTSKVSSPNQGQLTEYVSIWDNATGGNLVHQNWSGFVGTGNDASYTLPYGTLQDGHYYGWQTQGDDGLLRGPGSDTCHFAVDTTPPVFKFGDFTDPDTQFPPSGNGQTTKLRLGQEGRIPIAAYDPNPSGKLASGLACVRWSYDAQFATYDQSCGTPLNATEIRTTPKHWGTNILYAKAYDEAGNSSQTASYAFYVPWAPGPVAFGDTTGDARPDLLVPDDAGNLVTHGRATDPGNPSVPATGVAARAAQAPEYEATGRTWKDYRVSHRGSVDPGVNTDDLVVHRDGVGGAQGGKSLYYYANTQSDPGRFTLGTKTNVARVNCAGGSAACPGFHSGTGDSWQYTNQITPIGSPKDARTPSRDIVGATGVLAVESDNLWYYPAKSNGTLAAPNLVAAGGWNDVDLMVPGNTLAIGSTDAVAPALWIRARTDANGRAAGDIYQYRLTTGVRADTYTTVTGVTASPAARIGWGVTTTHPVGSDGDLTDDGIPDFWAVADDGRILLWPGAATGGAVDGFNGYHYRGNTQAPTAHWPLAGDATALPSDQNGTATAVTYESDTVDGRANTKVAAFTGSPDSAITTGRAAADPHSSFTVSVWAKQDKSGVVAAQENTRGSAWMIYGEPGAWRFAIAYADNDSWSYDYTYALGQAVTFQPGVWTQLTASYNAATGQMSLYVNGTLAGSGYHAASSTPPVTGGVVIGRYRDKGQPSAPMAGRVSNLAVYSTAVAPTVQGEIRFATNADRCLDLPGGDAAAGVQLWTCNRTPAQAFSVNPDGTITAGGRCLDAGGAGTANGTAVGMWYCNNGGNQRWLPRADGSIYNPVSGRCLDITWGDASIGVHPELFDCNGTPAQKFSVPGLSTPVLPVINP